MTEHTLGDAPIEPEYNDMMNALAQGIDEILNGPKKEGVAKENGFVLMMFKMGEEGRCNYISNARREDITVLLREQLARFEGMPEARGHA